MNLPERADQASSREVSAGSKKRKADDDDDDSRKRTRPVVDVPRGFFDEQIETEKTSSKPVVEEANLPNGRGEAVTKPPQDFVRANGAAPILPSNPPTKIPIQSPTAPIDEDEWAAFERDVATPPPDPFGPFAPSALTASATISAAPMTAAELAAQSREQASLQARENREAEVEGEKEDAARALEEEFDEMEELEERVRRLREKREELRRKRVNKAEEDEKTEINHTNAADLEESEESGDEDDGWGLWKG